MASRGPDASAIEQFEGDGGAAVQFGHRRLSIQDVSAAGNQPMTSASGRYSIIYNGEVYNAPELRRRLEEKGVRFRSSSDTEVVLEGYAAWGHDLFAMLHGMFALAIWDQETQSLIVARDHIGIKPLYFSADREVISLASDARALRVLGHGQRMDPDAQALYLMLGYVPTPHAIWSGIRKLEPGTVMVWVQGKDIETRQFWSAPEALDYEGKPGNLAELIDSVVDEQLLSDVPVGLFLSGGIDSSLIASSIARVAPGRSDVTCMSVGFPDNAVDDEAPVAKRTADALGLPLEVLPLARGERPTYREAVATLDEPLAFSAIVTQTAISRLASDRGLKVVLTGDGGDELFGGYSWYDTPLQDVHAPVPEPSTYLDHILRKRRRLFAHGKLDRDWGSRHPAIAHVQSVHPGLRADQAAQLLDRRENEVTELLRAALEAYDRPGLPERRRRQRLDLYTFCMDVVLPKVDRAGMDSSLEARPPLLDHRIIDWALSRPVTPANDGEPKASLRAILRERGLGFLLDEPKRGFSLKSRDEPDRRSIEADIDAAVSSLGIGRDWRRSVPRRTRYFGQRLSILHWLALWRDTTTDPG